ncbi:bactofilin family protein [Aliikangiella sp. IMCC44359]|uniref:bactofilin family protein n=1 Tax=Aliikangiella sp. IMCC44359 TaxID=3459125 RepID=UPI00403AFB5C
MNDTILGSKNESGSASASSVESKPFFSSTKEEKPKQYPQTNEIQSELVKEQSVIGKNIKFRGELIGTENLHIEGTVEGTVIMEGQNLSIGREGVLNANIHAQNLVINGSLTGDVLADELIEIRKTAVVKGSLIAPRIQLDDGGKFRGSMDMIDTEEEKKQRHEEFKQKLIHPDLPSNDGSVKAEPVKSEKEKSESDTKVENPTKVEASSDKSSSNSSQDSRKDYDKKKSHFKK